MNKKAYLHHPLTWIIAAFLLGVILTILVAKNIIPLGLKLC